MIVTQEPQSYPVLPTLEINEKAQKLWKEGKTIFHLGFGENRFPAPPLLIDALQRHAHAKSYLASQGLLELREAIADNYKRYFNIHTDKNHILVGPGSKPLIFTMIQYLPGDVLLPRPSWVSYAPHARHANKAVHWMDTSAEHHFFPTGDQIRQTCRQVREAGGKPGILILNAPCNPTSTAPSAAQCEEIAQACRDEGLYIISDELYARIIFPGESYASIATFYPEGTFVIGGISKYLALGGWRLGLCIFPDNPQCDPYRQAALRFASEIWSSPAAPMQYAAMEAYAEPAELTAYIDASARFHAYRTLYLYDGLEQRGINSPKPTGAFYLYADFEKYRTQLAAKGMTTSAELANHLLEKYYLVTLPGTAFGDYPERLTLRLSTSYLDCENEDKADALFTRWCNSSQEPGFINEATHPMMMQTLQQWDRFLQEIQG